MKALFLAMDAFGGLGGIAKYNRDFLRALCAAPEVSEVVAVPRRMPLSPEALPPNLTYIVGALPGRMAYIKAVIGLFSKKGKFDLICCGHIKLLPMAFLAKLIIGAPLVLIIYGVDAWTPIYSNKTKYLFSKIDWVISIGEITKQKFMEWSHVSPEKIFILPNAVTQSYYGVGPKSQALVER